MKSDRNLVRDALFGFAVGDALGLPVEFKSRSVLKENPIKDMVANGTHNQPAGTWSDDSSLSFITIESLCQGYDILDFCDKLRSHYFQYYWTPYGRSFHLENSTKNAIERLNLGVSHKDSGDFAAGNGALMRILPMAFHTLNESQEIRFKKVKEISSITHSNPRSVVACFIYTEFCIQIIRGEKKLIAYKNMQKSVTEFLKKEAMGKEVLKEFDRILKNTITTYFEDEIKSSCHVVCSLEAVLWSFLKSHSYVTSVLKAVNLGEDTDTNAALTGGLSGIYYGSDSIPKNWIEILPKKNDIAKLAEKYQDSISALVQE